jgi:predicted nucleotide-binding protein
MPPRKTASPEEKVLTLDEQRAAAGRLEARIAELRALDVSKIESGSDPSVQDLEQRIKSTLANIYGDNSRQYQRLQGATHLDTTSYTLSLDFGYGHGGGGTPVSEIREGVDRGRNRAISILQGEVDALKENLQFLPSSALPQPAATQIPKAEPSDEIFIVHGRDDAAKEIVARVISRAGLKPVILHEQPNGGKTIIEKFEKHGSAAGFAVIIASPDDVGGLAGSGSSGLQPRARQNVIGEMFWFAGRLGRERVCALVKGDIEMPTDFAGVVYTPMDAHGGWKNKLLQELDAAGYENLNWREALK